MKKTVMAVIAVFVSWEILDFLIHNILLASTYAQTSSLWRPEAEMKMGLLLLVTFVSAVTFVLIFDWFFKEKNVMTGLKYGLLLGIGFGFSMGYGTYSFQPILYTTAFGWFLGTVVEFGVAGAITGMIIKDE